MSDEQMMEIAVLENLQREDLTPLEEAQAYQMLMDKLSLTQAQVASRLGKSRPYIANYLRLLGLPKVIKEFLNTGKLSMGQARTILGLKDKSKGWNTPDFSIDEANSAKAFLSNVRRGW